jgi:hypothetical protein
MSTQAAFILPLTITPCSLYHNLAKVASSVVFDPRDASPNDFLIARSTDSSDTSLSFTITPERVTILLHEPTDIVWEVKSTFLPPMVIAARYGDTIKPLRSFGSGDLSASAQVAATRSGSDIDLIVGIDFTGKETAAVPPDSAYHRVSWCVDSRARSLRFAVVGSCAGPLILRPKKED